jgi:hypothetical protein
MRFFKHEHFRVPGHAHTLQQGHLIIQRVIERFWNIFEQDDEEDEDKAKKAKKAKQKWREEFVDLKETFAGDDAAAALEHLLTVYEDEDLPDEISKSLEPLIAELKVQRPEIVAYVFDQLDSDCFINYIEDGHERTIPDPDNPTYTIVWKNGQWRHCRGTAAAIVAQLMEEARCVVSKS